MTSCYIFALVTSERRLSSKGTQIDLVFLCIWILDAKSTMREVRGGPTEGSVTDNRAFEERNQIHTIFFLRPSIVSIVEAEFHSFLLLSFTTFLMNMCLDISNSHPQRQKSP